MQTEIATGYADRATGHFAGHVAASKPFQLFRILKP